MHGRCVGVKPYGSLSSVSTLAPSLTTSGRIRSRMSNAGLSVFCLVYRKLLLYKQTKSKRLRRQSTERKVVHHPVYFIIYKVLYLSRGFMYYLTVTCESQDRVYRSLKVVTITKQPGSLHSGLTRAHRTFRPSPARHRSKNAGAQLTAPRPGASASGLEGPLVVLHHVAHKIE